MSALRETSPLLKTMGLTKSFGGLNAVVDFDMTVERGEILGLIGPNGAGKTTFFNLITGFLRSDKGKVFFKDEDVTNLRPYQIVKKGIVRSFQANILFHDKTVKENVLLGFHTKYRKGFFNEFTNTNGYRKEHREIEERVDRILSILHLIHLKDHLARNLTHGYQRMLGVAVALATSPELFLLDEPVTGMNKEEKAMMMNMTRVIRDQGVTILLVEHDMKVVMRNCDRIIVMDYGMKIAEGTPLEISSSERVIGAYLGKADFYA